MTAVRFAISVSYWKICFAQINRWVEKLHVPVRRIPAPPDGFFASRYDVGAPKSERKLRKT
jgi:hypothetical protein